MTSPSKPGSASGQAEHAVPLLQSGAAVTVVRGPAHGARGWVRGCLAGRVTLLAALPGHRPIVLTVDAADCQLLAPLPGAS